MESQNPLFNTFNHFCAFNLFIYSKDSTTNTPLFLLHKSSKTPAFSHFPGKFDQNDPAIIFAVAREFVSRTGGIFYSENLKYLVKENPEPLVTDLVMEKDLNAQIIPQKTYTLPVNDVCRLLCECSHIYQDDQRIVSYFVELPLLNTEVINEVAKNKGMSLEVKYFTLEEILQKENISEDLTTILQTPDLNTYIENHIIKEEPIETKDHFAVISCDPMAKTFMLNSLHYSVFKKHGENWRYYRAYEGDLPTDEELKKIKGIVIPGSSQSAYDTHLPWFGPVIELINKIVKEYKQINLLGICFGAQIIAQALGGKVEKMNKDFVRGGDLLKTQPCFYELGYVKELNLDQMKPFVIGKAHGDHIVELPPGAVVHASSGTTEVEIFTIGDNVLAIQGHPEFNEAWTAGANYRMKKLNVEDYEKYVEEFIQEKFPHKVTQEELLKISYFFLKKNSHHFNS
jgi:GMP synthase-like glutamine amidotransferase